MKTRRKYNPVMNEWLIKNSQNYTCKELIPILEEKFNEIFTLKQMQQYFWHHPELTMKYENKNKSHSNKALPIGSERIKADGMHQIKVGPKKWEYKQRLIWKEYYGEDLKEDEYIIFLDQNRNNFDINNLQKVSRRESAIMINQKAFSKNKEATKLGILVAKTIIKTKEISKNENESFNN